MTDIELLEALKRIDAHVDTLIERARGAAAQAATDERARIVERLRERSRTLLQNGVGLWPSAIAFSLSEFADILEAEPPPC